MKNKEERRFQNIISLMSILFLIIFVTFAVSRMSQSNVTAGQSQHQKQKLTLEQADDLIVIGFLPIFMGVTLFKFYRRDEESSDL